MTRFTTGTGRLSADMLNGWQETSNTVNQMALTYQSPGWEGPVLMKVLNSVDMMKRGPETDPGTPGTPGADPPYSDYVAPTYGPDVAAVNRWQYDLQEVSIDVITNPETWGTMTRATDGDYAINLTEVPNSDTHCMGVDLANLPAGFELQPIPDGAIVWAYFNILAEDPGFMCVFSSTNQFDGVC